MGKVTWIATRLLKVGHGTVHAGEQFPEEPTPALIHAGYVEKGEGPVAADPLAGVNDPTEAERIRQAQAPTAPAAKPTKSAKSAKAAKPAKPAAATARGAAKKGAPAAR